TAEVEKHGGTVTMSTSYSPGENNFEEIIRRITNSQAARQVSTSYQAQVGFSALFIPDSPAQVAKILPILAFHDITRMQYLGTPLWLNHEFLLGSARYLQNSVIPAPLSSLSERWETTSFINAFTTAYGREPDQFAAYGHDAGLAILQAINLGAATRAEMREALASGQTIFGAAAPFTFGPNGDYVAEATLLTVEDRQFELLREAGGNQ
ncbi:MAG: ABC transporter substrate-binding protein, partial [Candidatus Adiutrix sp.]